MAFEVGASPVERELLKASKMNPPKVRNEKDYYTYLRQLVSTVNEVPDDVWDALSEDAQDWINASVDAINMGDSPPPFPDAGPAESTADTGPVDATGHILNPESQDDSDPSAGSEPGAKSQPNDSSESHQSSDPSGRNESAENSDPRTTNEPNKQSDPKQSSEPRRKTAPHAYKNLHRGKGKGAGYRVKQIMVEQGFDKSAEYILEQLQKEGYTYTISTLRTVRADFIQSWRAIKDMGLLRDDAPDPDQ